MCNGHHRVQDVPRVAARCIPERALQWTVAWCGVVVFYACICALSPQQSKHMSEPHISLSHASCASPSNNKKVIDAHQEACTSVVTPAIRRWVMPRPRSQASRSVS
jgi:hypothetical protein